MKPSKGRRRAMPVGRSGASRLRFTASLQVQRSDRCEMHCYAMLRAGSSWCRRAAWDCRPGKAILAALPRSKVEVSDPVWEPTLGYRSSDCIHLQR